MGHECDDRCRAECAAWRRADALESEWKRLAALDGSNLPGVQPGEASQAAGVAFRGARNEARALAPRRG